MAARDPDLTVFAGFASVFAGEFYLTSGGYESSKNGQSLNTLKQLQNTLSLVGTLYKIARQYTLGDSNVKDGGVFRNLAIGRSLKRSAKWLGILNFLL